MSKYKKGNEIATLDYLVFLLLRGDCIYWRHKVQNASFLFHMQLSVLKGAVDTGILYEAKEKE